ncbi:MAG TPA: response regulator [Mycobacteriales bacterium]|jgi:CheY-like chemotaxis protein|nr:response regulator [Mycobacteriales bacterium]
MCAADVDADEMRRLLDPLWRKNRAAVLGRLARVRAAVDAGGVLDDDAAEDLHALVGTLGTYGWSHASQLVQQISRTIDGPTAERSVVLRQLDELRVALTEPDAPAEVLARSTHRQLLAIDDQSEIRDVIRLAIESTTDWSVTTCPTVTAAVQAAATAAPDVVLLDVHLAGGPVERSVVELRPHVRGPIILLTAAPLTAAEVRRTGADGLLEKPFDPMRLAAAIDRIVAGAA